MLTPLAFKGGAHCYAEVWHFVAFFVATWPTSLWQRIRGAHWQPTCHACDPIEQIVFVVPLLLLVLVAFLVGLVSSSWSSRR